MCPLVTNSVSIDVLVAPTLLSVMCMPNTHCSSTVIGTLAGPVACDVPHLAHTSAGGAFEGSPPSARRALGFCWAPVLATLPEGATVEGGEALSPISFHISRAACVRLAQHATLSAPQCWRPVAWGHVGVWQPVVVAGRHDGRDPSPLLVCY